MFHCFTVIAEAVESSNMVTGGVGLVVSTLLGLLGWFVKSWLVDVVRAVNRLSGAVDRNTKATTIALLSVAALVPGSRPMLEELRSSADEHLRKPEEET